MVILAIDLGAGFGGHALATKGLDFSVNGKGQLDFFGDIFGGGGGGGRRRNRAQRGNDLREDLTLTFEEAVFGIKKQVKIRRYEACEEEQTPMAEN